MRIRSVRIRNFRGFEDETFNFDSHTCLLGPNGAGKSTVLAALNIFFQEPSATTNIKSLSAEDFHNGNTDDPVQITVTFCELPERAKRELSHYVRHGELIAKAEAGFDPESGHASVKRFGERLVFSKFAPFFKDEKDKAKVAQLRERFSEITADIPDFPDVGSSPAKNVMIDSLRKYEEDNPEECSPEPSSDLFYGTTGGKHKLDPFVQWVYLPAVKDASEEAEETGSTALGKLLQRTVRRKINFDEALGDLLKRTREQYDTLLEKNQSALEGISKRLGDRLATYSHSDAKLQVIWLQGSEKSVSIADPKAAIKAQEGVFKGSLPRFGHGLQRSFLLAILQELALIESDSGETEGSVRPTLILACEEPELYQHPPQARHLNNVLRTLAQSGSQVLLTTHSPYFASGESFEEIRLIRRDPASGKCSVRNMDFDRFSERIACITGKEPDRPAVARAKLHAALRPELSEMFFCDRLVLVEGIEDRAYITAGLVLEEKWDEVRRVGLHIVPADGKSGILQMLVIAQELEIPVFVMFDADGNVSKEEHRAEHKRDNENLMKALGVKGDPFPDAPLLGDSYAIWPTHIRAEIKKEIGEPSWTELMNKAKKKFDPGSSLAKNPLFIAEMLGTMWDRGEKPSAFVRLIGDLTRFAFMR